MQKPPEQTTRHPVFRLAMRVEGEFWNAYLASIGTMTDSVLLGSIRMTAVQDRDRKDRFMALMQESLAAAVRESTGVEISWPDAPESAPEHERSGSA
jgi:hypothetical protein